MHPNRKFHVEDRHRLAAFVAEQGFGTLVAESQGKLHAVHVPFLLDGETVRFHLSRGNQVHDALVAGARALLVVNGPHGYVSPDDYGLEDRVPTWNYVAVEMEGPVSPLEPEALVEFLDVISDHHEARLAPKPIWKRDKMTSGRFDGLLKAITGFEMAIAEWRGTFKLDQDKPIEVRRRLADALDARGEAPIASWIRP